LLRAASSHSCCCFSSLCFWGEPICGWACPAAGLHRLSFKVNDKLARGGRYNWIKYGLWVPWLAVIGFAALLAGRFHRVDPFYQTLNGVSVYDGQSLFVLVFFVGVIASLSMALGKRAFCHYGCWMAPFMVVGTKIKDAVGWPSLHLRADTGRCVGCMQCSRNCPMSLDIHEMVERGSMKNSECILCMTCVDVCPTDTINFYFETPRQITKN